MSSDSIRVVVRFRPPLHNPSHNTTNNQHQRYLNESNSRNTIGSPGKNSQNSLYTFHDDKTSISVHETTGHELEYTTHKFSFDRIFGFEASQEQIFTEVARDTVADVVEGFNGTILCYGQTSSGKSHTMFGPPQESTHTGRTRAQSQIVPCRHSEPSVLNKKAEYYGIAHRCCKYLFEKLNNEDVSNFAVSISFVEIYLESFRDLLVQKPTAHWKENDDLRIRTNIDGEVFVEGLSERFISSPEEMMILVDYGLHARTTSVTHMNETSSRSHAILTVHVQQTMKNGTVRTSKLNLADLAGTERVKQSQSTGVTLDEARKINASLSSLGLVINTLSSSSQSHIPYRDSKLTFLLQDSLGGNCRTRLIVCCTPEPENLPQTLSSLRFARRSKGVVNHPIRNKQLTRDDLLRLVARLKKELKAHMKTTGKTAEGVSKEVNYIKELETSLASLRDERDQLALKLTTSVLFEQVFDQKQSPLSPISHSNYNSTPSTKEYSQNNSFLKINTNMEFTPIQKKPTSQPLHHSTKKDPLSSSFHFDVGSEEDALKEFEKEEALLRAELEINSSLDESILEQIGLSPKNLPKQLIPQKITHDHSFELAAFKNQFDKDDEFALLRSYPDPELMKIRPTLFSVATNSPSASILSSSSPRNIHEFKGYPAPVLPAPGPRVIRMMPSSKEFDSEQSFNDISAITSPTRRTFGKLGSRLMKQAESFSTDI